MVILKALISDWKEGMSGDTNRSAGPEKQCIQRLLGKVCSPMKRKAYAEMFLFYVVHCVYKECLKILQTSCDRDTVNRLNISR